MLAAAPTLDELLQRFQALTDAANRACATQDAAALAGALDARELATAYLLSFARTKAKRLPLPAATRRLIDMAVKSNGELEAKVIEARDEIRRQLERLTQDESAVAGYAGSAPRTSRVDVTR